MKKADFSALSRHDIFWACDSCMPKACNLVQSNTMHDGGEKITEQISRLETKFENQISRVMKEDLPKAINDCIAEMKGEVTNTVKKNMTKLWSEVVGTTPATENNKQNRKGENSCTIENVVRKVIVEQKTEDIQREARSNNFIIYRGEESPQKDAAGIKADDEKIVNDLLQEIEIDEEPSAITRLGRYQAPAEGEERRPRPIKVSMKNSEVRDRVMQNLSKLKNAPEKIKKIGSILRYDQRRKTNSKRKSN